MAAVQVVIFLLLGGLIFILQKIEGNALDYSMSLTRQIDEANQHFISIADANEYEELYNLAAQFIETQYPVVFDPEWLVVIIENVPKGVQLVSLDFSGIDLILSAIADDITDIGTHQQILSETGVFEPVLFGEITRQEDGRVRYFLRLGVG